MLRMKPIANAKRAELYYSKSDGGYYLDGEELHREWGGQGAKMLGLEDKPEFEQFKRLIHGLDPNTGGQLTSKLINERIPAWDITASVPKGVTLAIERGDSRVRDALWQANREAMQALEAYATTRVRKGGRQEDRITGNLIWYSDEHPETRPVVDESLPEDHPWRVMPDMDRHIHNVLFNETFDPVEQEWKAVKFRPIMDLRKYFDRYFDSTLSHKLAELGYEIETTRKASGKDSGKYHSWDIRGFPEAVIKGNSRRSGEVDQLEQEIIAGLQADGAGAPDQLSAVAKDKLGATSRLQKREDLTLKDYREFWDSRISPDESREIAEVIKRAMLGQNPRPEPNVERAASFAVRHHFEQLSVVPYDQLAITAMERAMGNARPADIDRELQRQGVITREIDGRKMATTEAVRREEQAIVGFAANSRGSVCPVGLAEGLERGSLNDGQWQAVSGLLESPNRVNLVQGPAGAGKSFMLQRFDQGVRQAGGSVTYLAATTDAAEVLKRDGFQVNTLARFLLDEKLQGSARGGRVVIDESSLIGHADAVKFFQLAEKLDLKPIFVGDPMQHGSVPRGALMRVLTDFAGVKPFQLSEILRQERPDYRAAATKLSQGQTAEGFDAIDRLGWISEIENEQARYAQVAADYLQAVRDKKSIIVVSPTHAEAKKITDEIRSQLRDAGKLGQDEREFSRLVAVNASEAERGERETYRPGDVLQFHQNAKGFTKGERFTVTDPAMVPIGEAAKFQLYRPETIRLAEGDIIRFTGTVKSIDDRHKLANGATQTVAGFSKAGDIQLKNGWVISAQAGHFRSGFVDTSFSSQGKTTQRAILAMSAASLPATNQEQLYVSSSRAKERMTLYTDDKQAVRDAVQRSSQKLTALDMVPPERKKPVDRPNKRKAKRRRLAFFDRVREALKHWTPKPEREASRGR